MRYDDRLSTVLGAAVTGARAQALKWRQLLDLLAQRAGGFDDEAAQAALRWLDAERANIPLAERMAAARGIAGRRIPVPLLLFFASDTAVVSAPVLRGARLAGGDWLAILPRLGPTARALLRHRDDLPPAVGQALTAFGASDLQIGTDVQPEPEVEPAPPADGGQIRNLVARIEAFRQQRDADRQPPATPERPAPRSFRWEASINGLVAWTDAPDRGALIGLPLAGDDRATTHAAVSARRPFRDFAVRVPAWGSVLLSGVPVFAPDGRFTGYRGTGHRSATVTALEPAPVAMREMIHELRTPLNAIAGFAEMIVGEYLGPAAPDQRARADEIVKAAQSLTEALADIDLSARTRPGEGATDLQDLLVDEHETLERRAEQAGGTLAFAIEPGLPPAALDRQAAHRLLDRLVSSALVGAGEGARVRLMLRRGGQGAVELRIEQPSAPLDGLAARVLRALVESTGGRFSVAPDAWRAVLPTAAAQPERRAAG